MFSVFFEPVEAGAENGVVAGLFIPLVDLPGMAFAELATTGTALDSHEIYSLLNSLYSGLALIPSLGIVGLTKSTPTGTGTNKFTEGIGLTVQFVLNLQSRSLSIIPLPEIGTEAGRGAVFAEDIWPDCQKIGTEGAIPGAGLLIPDSWIATYGAETLTAVDVDAREWIGALMVGILAGASPRTATVPSGIVTRTNPSAIRMTGFAIPASWYDAANPLTGLSAGDLSRLRIVQETYLIEYELLVNPENQTLEINVATTG